MAAMSMLPMGEQEALQVAIIGGGVVGLSLALHLVERGMPSLHITIYDRKWKKDDAGKFHWTSDAEQKEDWRVLTLSEDLLQNLPTAVRRAVSSMGEYYWPRSLNVSTVKLQEKLLEMVQQPGAAPYVTLKVGPPDVVWDRLSSHGSDNESAPSSTSGSGLDAYRAWLQALDSNRIIAADWAVTNVRRAFKEELSTAPPLSSKAPLEPSGGAPEPPEYFLGVALQEEKAPTQPRLLSMAISCSQMRFFYNPDGSSGHGFLSVRLTAEEYAQLNKAHGPLSHCQELYSADAGGAGSLAELQRLCESKPWLRSAILDGAALFGCAPNAVLSVSVSRTRPRAPASQAFHCAATRGVRVCLLPEDAGLAGRPQAPGGRPSRGPSAGLEAAFALARVLQAGLPLDAFECFAHTLRCRDMSVPGKQDLQLPSSWLQGGTPPRGWGGGGGGESFFSRMTTPPHSSRGGGGAGAGAAGPEAARAAAIGGGAALKFAEAVRRWHEHLQGLSGVEARQPMHDQEVLDRLSVAGVPEATLSRLAAWALPAPEPRPAAAAAAEGPGAGVQGSPAPPTSGLPWLERLVESSKSPCETFATALEAWAMAATGSPEQALLLLGADDVEQTEEPRLQDILSLIVRAEASLRKGDLRLASELCAKARSLHPDNTLGLMLQAEVGLRRGEVAAAIEDCTSVIERNPDFMRAYTVRAEAQLELGKYKEARVDCEWAMNHGARTAMNLTLRGRAQLKLGNVKEAISDCDQALQKAPYFPEAFGVRGKAYVEQGEWSSAVSDLTQALRLVGAAASASSPPPQEPPAPAAPPPPPRRAAEEQPPVGPARRPSAKWAVGVLAWSGGIAEALAARADALVALQRFEEAIRDCDEALKFQTNSMALAVRGEAKLLCHKYADAVEDCTAALAMEPQDAYTYVIRGEARLVLGETTEAISDCDQALEIHPHLEYAVSVRERANGVTKAA